MEVITIISQVLLYVCFSLLAGSFLLLLVPNNYRPDLRISKGFMSASVITVPIVSFIPILDITRLLAPRLGFVDSLKMVLTTYTVGTAWNFTLLASVLLLLLMLVARRSEQGVFAFLGIGLTLGLILTVAWSSHAGAVDPVRGIISDFIHLTASSIWVGVILVVGWNSVNHHNWLKFLRWFSMVAISCLVITAISGLMLMSIMVDDYPNSWRVSYGQGLLIKHVFLLPLIFYAFVNGALVKSLILRNSHFNPIPWVRLEGLILLVIFAITAVFSQKSPPYGNYMSNEAVSPLFRLFHDEMIDASSTIAFAENLNTVFFLVLSISLLGLMGWSFFKKTPIIISFFFSSLCVLSVYMMLMVSVVVR